MKLSYLVAGKFQGVQFSWMGNLVTFRGSIFADVQDHAIYKHAYFTGLIFALHESTMKTVKIGPRENFPLYGISDQPEFMTLMDMKP